MNSSQLKDSEKWTKVAISKLNNAFAWPSPISGLAFHILSSPNVQSPEPFLRQISFPDGSLDTAPTISACGYAIYNTPPTLEQANRWKDSLNKISNQDPFPRDRQTFAFRPAEVVGIALGLKALGLLGHPISLWFRSVIEQLPSKNPVKDNWALILYHYAAQLSGNSWSAGLSSVISEYDLHELCLLHTLISEQRVHCPAGLQLPAIRDALESHRENLITHLDRLRSADQIAATLAGMFVFRVKPQYQAPQIQQGFTSHSPQHDKRTVVVLVHGIRTSGKWIRRIKPILEKEANCFVEAAGFGFLDVIRFVLPGPTRKSAIQTVSWKISHAVNIHKDCELIIIAHSFGTYCVTEMLKTMPHIRPIRLVLCGGIVAQGFRWDSLSQMSPERAMSVVNECGARDIWPLLAHSFTSGYGTSGASGFLGNRPSKYICFRRQ